ncbi:MAG TPA: PAS domain S-box protein [Bryobacteraceae bacterium]|nr:PAS domain S-box protein [Bryobacteraceae bacterium]
MAEANPVPAKPSLHGQTGSNPPPAHAADDGRREEALRWSEEGLRLVVEAGELGLWDCDLATGELICSDRCLALFGFEPGTRGSYQKFLASVHPEDRERADVAVRDALQSGAGCKAAMRMVWPDGSIHWVDVRGRVFRDASGRPMRISGIALEIVGVELDVAERVRAEQTLRLSEEKFAKAFAINPAAIALTRLPDGAIVDVNDTWQTMFGYRREEVLGCTGLALGLWPAAETRNDFLTDLLREGSVRNREQRLRTRSGQELIVLTSAELLAVRGEQLVVSNSLDITSRKYAEDALRESEEKLRSAFAHAAIGFALNSIDGRYMDANPAYCTLCGYSLDELRTLTIPDLIHPADYGENMRLIQSMLDGAVPGFIIEGRYLRKDREAVWVRKSVSLVRDANGAPKWTIALVEDITGRKRDEAALRESEHRFRSLFENSLDAVFLSVADGRILAANPAACALFGMTEEEICRKRREDLVDPSDPRLRAGVEERRIEGRVRRELTFLRKDGTRFEGDVSSVIVSESGRAFVIVRDITESKREEERLRQTQKLESIGLLAAGIAHDFNNLLTSVAGNASLLLQDAGPDHTEFVRSILDSVDRGAHLTRQLLAYSGKGQFVVRNLDVSEVVQSTVSLVEFSIPKSATLTLNLEQRLPSVVMDPSQLQQVVMNLVSNAGEAIGEGNPGRIRVATSVAEIENPFQDALAQEVVPGRYVCIEVGDTGTGIDPDKHASIFDPFFTTRFLGRGLGLAAVAGILRSHRGGITLDSAPGKGSTFRVFLPVAGRTIARSQENAAHRSGAFVLVVDDESPVREFMVAALEREGYRVLQASDGREALSLPDVGAAIDAAIVDIVMPNMSVADLLAGLNHRYPGIRILLTSGYSEPEARRLSATHSDAAFLQKPYTAPQLAGAVKDLLTGKRN